MTILVQNIKLKFVTLHMILWGGQWTPQTFKGYPLERMEDALEFEREYLVITTFTFMSLGRLDVR